MIKKVLLTQAIGLLFASSFLFLAASTCRAATVEIKGVVRDGAGVPVPLADVVLYHQRNYSTATRAGSDGTYSITTSQPGGTLVILTVHRRGYNAAVSMEVTIPVMPTDPIERDVQLTARTRPARGKEQLQLSEPPLTADSSMEAYIHAANGVTKCVWNVAQATQLTMFADTISWEPVQEVERVGAASDFFDLKLSPRICGQHQHVKLRVIVKIHYDDGTDIEVEGIRLLSRTSAFAGLMPVDPGDHQ